MIEQTIDTVSKNSYLALTLLLTKVIVGVQPNTKGQEGLKVASTESLEILENTPKIGRRRGLQSINALLVD